jgi:hypothetical protein
MRRGHRRSCCCQAAVCGWVDRRWLRRTVVLVAVGQLVATTHHRQAPCVPLVPQHCLPLPAGFVLHFLCQQLLNDVPVVHLHSSKPTTPGEHVLVS